SYGCMASVIEKACEKAGATVKNTTGTSLADLCSDYIDKKRPVLVWATVNMSEKQNGNVWYLADGTRFVWPKHEHCLLLVGYDDQNYYFNDPMEGATVKYEKSVVEQRYAELGKQSLSVR
ncbi:MAG: C39 family peptidase, partial [Oscillospiraceae bacterium]|nr:C39 family peptidase [Candidatus Equicaccousia limihippi]